MATDVHPGDTWAGVVTSRVPSQMHAVTTIQVEKVCGPNTTGCPDYFRGAHAHVVTMPGRKRARTVSLRRFRDHGGRTYTVDRIRCYGGGSSYYLVDRPAPVVGEGNDAR